MKLGNKYYLCFLILFSYQYGPDTYLLQLRDVNFPVRLREYMKVAHRRSPSFALNDSVDWSVSIHATNWKANGY